MEDALKITNMELVPCEDTTLDLGRVTFKQNGYQRTWDYLRLDDELDILLYNKTKDSFILSKEFRAGPFLNNNSKQMKEEVSDIQNKTSEKDFKVVAPFEHGITYELCAGTVDSQTETELSDIMEIAGKLVEKKLGYCVTRDKLQKIYQSNHVGHSGERSTVLFATVEDKDVINEGSTIHTQTSGEGDYFEIFHLPRSEAKAFAISDDFVKNSKVIASILWYFCHFE